MTKIFNTEGSFSTKHKEGEGGGQADDNKNKDPVNPEVDKITKADKNIEAKKEKTRSGGNVLKLLYVPKQELNLAQLSPSLFWMFVCLYQ